MGQWYISHQCIPGSNPRLARSGLNAVVGTPFVQFCSVAPVFLPPQELTFRNSNSIWIQINCMKITCVAISLFFVNIFKEFPRGITNWKKTLRQFERHSGKTCPCELLTFDELCSTKVNAAWLATYEGYTKRSRVRFSIGTRFFSLSHARN